jgi:beta-galactosidase/beta-glucuronidase
MVRPESTWQHLNGIWEIDYTVVDLSNPPFGESLGKEILVPYPLESSLSGIRELAPNNSMFYRREFDSLTANCTGRTLLHFEASDYNTTVWVNSQLVGNHVGGYDPFSFDITSALAKSGSGQEIIVGVHDATEADRMDQSYGKQCRSCFDKPSGMNYSPSSGIWATVWAECVPNNFIEDVYLQPDIDAKILKVTVDTKGPAFDATSGASSGSTSGSGSSADQYSVAVSMFDADGKQVTSAHSAPGTLTAELQVPDAEVHLWSPDNPYLYNVHITLERAAATGGAASTSSSTVDAVDSYVGMRKVSIGKAKLRGTVDPVPMVLLNNEVAHLIMHSCILMHS